MMKNSILLAAVSLLIFAGCSGKIGLSGKVVFSDDGSPLTVGVVCFEKPGFVARGNIQPDGTFVVGSIRDTDGLPPGSYQVYISEARKLISGDGEGDSVYEQLVDPKFTSAATSGITVEITSTTRNFEVVVDRYPK